MNATQKKELNRVFKYTTDAIDANITNTSDDFDLGKFKESDDYFTMTLIITANADNIMKYGNKVNKNWMIDWANNDGMVWDTAKEKFVDKYDTPAPKAKKTGIKK